MPSVLPDGDPAPADGSLPGVGARRPGRRGRSGSTCTCRSARCAAATATSTPTPPSELGRRGPAPRGRRTPTPRSPRSGWPAGCSATRDLPVSTRSSSAAARRRCCRPADLAADRCAAIDDEFGLAAGAEVTTEANPDSVDRRRPRRAARRRASPGSRSACSPRSPHVLRGARPHPRPARGCPAWSAWARAAGFEQVSLDLIYGTPGESLDDWRDLARRRAGLRARPRLGVLADRRGRAPRWPGRSRRGELPMPDDDDLADKYLLADERARPPPGSAGTRCPTGRATEAGRCRHNLALLDRRRLVGRRPGAHSPRRRRALVERASTRRRTPTGSPPALSPAHGPRGARRRDPARRAGAARAAAARRAAASTCSTPAAAPRSPAWSPTGLRRRRGAGRLVLTLRGRLLADAVVRDLLP